MPEEKKSVFSDLELDELSTKELEALLRLDFYESDNREPDISGIMAFTEVICRRERECPDYVPVNIDKAWREFQKNHILSTDSGRNHEKNPPQTISKFPNKKRHFRFHRFASASLVSVLLVAIFISSVSGANLFDFLTKWTTETFLFTNSKKEESDTTVPLSDDPMKTLRDTVAEYSSLSVVPKWCPQGTLEERIQVSEQEDRVRIYGLFLKGNQSFAVSITVYPGKRDGVSDVYEKDSNPVEEYGAGGVTHYLMSNLETNKVVWTYSNLECSISGEIPINELKIMVDSIYKEK